MRQVELKCREKNTRFRADFRVGEQEWRANWTMFSEANDE